MKLKLLKSLRMSVQLYILVAAMLAMFTAQSLYMMNHVRQTEKTLKFTIDNRLKTSQFLQDISSALIVSLETAHRVARGAMDADAAADLLEPELATARENWDNYFLSTKIPEEEALAGDTTEVLDAAFTQADRLVSKLKSGDSGLDAWVLETLAPAVDAAQGNVGQLIALQATAADIDQKNNQDATRQALFNSLLVGGSAALLALALAFLIIRGALRKLGADPGVAAGIASRIAEGDYQFEMKSGEPENSLLAALRRMKDSLLHAKLDYEGQINAISKVQGVVELSPEGTILHANENFLKLLGYSLEEVKGKHHSMFLDAIERENAGYKTFWGRMARGEFAAGQYRRATKDGREVWVQATYNPILDSSGKPFKVVMYATDITEQRTAAQLNAAFKGALGTLGTNVMVANNDFDVIYVNENMRQLMLTAQQDFRRDLPGFDAGKLIGQSLDAFQPNAAQYRRVLEDLTGTHVSEIRLGGRTMRLVANPMKDEGGRRLGTVIEWFDRTQELATETELQDVIGAVTDGDLSRRISLADKTGFFETLSKGINDLVENVAVVVDEVQQLVSAANGGDLTRRVQVEGRAGLLVKIGTGINQLTDNMASVVAQVKQAAAEVSRGADEISQGNTNLSQRTEEQASSLEETASSMEQMTSTVKQNADNAGQANQLAVAARDQAEKGGAVVAKAVKAMSEINEASKKIADIIGVIDEIAFQTNLLALNAAVEAARAGEQGRGFAVVASEVRNLAGRSATAAKEIKALIQDSVKKVDEGSSLVTQSGSTLDQIVAAVKKVTDIVAEIAAASHEQSAGIDQVSKAVMQLDELTQQNAALVEQASAASQAMAEQARHLNERMSGYRVDVAALERAGVHVGQPAANDAGSARPAVERRKAGRPWAAKADAAPGAAGKVAPPATGTDDAVWKEF
jgi:methyl-accepting chemotaxis protein